MKSWVREYGFMAVAFLLGSINVVYNIAFYGILVLAFLVNISIDFGAFRENVRKERIYVILPLCGALYLVIHYLCSLFFPDIPYKVSWATIELLLLYFFLMPLYLLSVKKVMTPVLLRKALFSLCWGIMLFNVVKFFCITGSSIFEHPLTALNDIYKNRFGGNMELLGGHVYLEPQALYIAVSAIISWYFLLQYDRKMVGKKIGISSGIIFALSLLFLSFTVTKGAILAFMMGFLLLTVKYFTRQTRCFRWIFVVILAGSMLLGYYATPQAYIDRVKQVEEEMEKVNEGIYKGGSIAPRWGLMKENFSHFDEFGIWGLGVYKRGAIRQWYATSPYQLTGIYNSHNSFVEFWLIGGIPGLLFILYYFFAPVIRMVRRRKVSFLVLASVLTVFIAANTCIVTILIDSSPFFVFIAALFFLYVEEFSRLEQPGKISSLG